MEAKDYLKSKKIWLGTKVADMNAPENYFNLEFLLEDYHQAKLKLLDIHDVSRRSELLFAFIAEIKSEFADENWDYLDFIAERVIGKQ